MKLAFACVGNAGRSQMAMAYAERERDRRGLDVDLVTGGTDPKGSIHEEVIEVLREDGIDVSDRSPREITPADVEDAAYIVTMGCSVEQFRPEGWTGEARAWSLDASGDGIEGARAQRDEIRERVGDFFTEIERELDG